MHPKDNGRKKMKRLLYPLAVMLVLSGCVVAIGAAGAGGALGYKYVKGELKTVYNANFSRVWQATLNALKDLKIKIIEKRSDLVEGEIKAKTGTGKSVKISIKSNGKITKVSIRVGILGDMDYSLAIKYRIDAYIKGEDNR